MRRVPPVMRIMAFLILMIVVLIWQISEAVMCGRHGGIVIGVLTRNQHCTFPRRN